MEEIRGTASPREEITPTVKPLVEIPGNGQVSGSTKALEFSGLYIFCRSYRQGSTLVQVNTKSVEDGTAIVAAADETPLPSRVVDFAKIDDHHVVASVGSTLDIWKRSESQGFLNMQCVRGCWQEASPMHIVVPRSEDSACLVAARDGVHCIQLDGKCQKLRVFKEANVVTSVNWHANERYVFSTTLDEGRLSLYDVRVSAPVATKMVQRGLFDHASAGGHAIACAGLGGVIHVFDTRKLSIPVHAVLDPHHENIIELSSSAQGDLLAFGNKGFTLWRTGSRATGMHFRGIVECQGGGLRGGFVDQAPGSSSQKAYTTDSRGEFVEWSVKRYEKRPQSKTVAVPPFKEPVRAAESRHDPRPAHDKWGPSQHRGHYQPHPDKHQQRRPQNPQTEQAAFRGSEQAPFEGGTGEWDWDLEWDEPSPQQGVRGGCADASGAPDEGSGILPLKDLDELIGFYLS